MPAHVHAVPGSLHGSGASPQAVAADANATAIKLVVLDNSSLIVAYQVNSDSEQGEAFDADITDEKLGSRLSHSRTAALT
jgi:hypothetical protein